VSYLGEEKGNKGELGRLSSSGLDTRIRLPEGFKPITGPTKIMDMDAVKKNSLSFVQKYSAFQRQ
jgi:hypothetical protein